MAECKLTLVGLKERLTKRLAQYADLELETPLVWEIPGFFEDHMYKSDLEKLVRNKHIEVRVAIIEKVGIFLLETLVQYFSKTLLEQLDLDRQFADIVQLIADLCGDLDLSADSVCPTTLKSELTFIVISTKYALDLLSPIFENNEPPRKPEGNLHIRGLKAWYYMSTFEHRKALRLFEKIVQCKENVAVYGYWYGKTLGRVRRNERTNFDISEIEIEMLLIGVCCKANIPTILMSLTNGKSQAPNSGVAEKVEELLQIAWESRHEYHSTNLTRIAVIFADRGESTKAHVLFDMALRFDPDCSMALHKYGAFLMDQDSDMAMAADMLIRANHLPAFLTLVKGLSDKKNCSLTIQTCLENIEENVTNISHPIRCILFRYHWDNGVNAKASFHLKILYTECKDTIIAISRSDQRRKKIQEVLQMSRCIPWEINISRDCENFRAVCSEFDKWLNARRNSYTKYTMKGSTICKMPSEI